MTSSDGLPSDSLLGRVRAALDAQPCIDMHTHLYAPAFGAVGDGGADPLLLWGIDELLSYHYFVDELFRVVGRDELTPEAFWRTSVPARADLVWRELFVKRTPVSEAAAGVIHVLSALGFDPIEPDLRRYRAAFAARSASAHVDDVMRLANVARIVMTNEPFNDVERARWLANPGVGADPRFAAVVRIDPLLTNWRGAGSALREWGYGVNEDMSGQAAAEVRRFLSDWIGRTKPLYLACSLEPAWRYAPDSSDAEVRRQARMIDACLIPTAVEHGLPLALMIGAKRAVHPEMQLAGDGLGRADVDSLCALARRHARAHFLVTLLSRENQHELCVAARKFANLTPFGCWWYLNTTSMVTEITRLRFELLGTSFIPQHSDARVLEQLIYKWRDARATIARCLAERYAALEARGYAVSDAQIAADAAWLLRDGFAARVGLA